MNWGKIITGVVILAGVFWLFRYITTPPPGKDVPDQGRTHVTAEEVAKTTYNSNPPTSGQHVETWVKPGVYTEPQKEGELIHALEHGYININYNCNAGKGLSASPADSAVNVATGSATNDTEDCKALVARLTSIAEKQKLWKLLVVPRPQLDTRIALTAWNRIDAFDELDDARIEAFITYWRDHGPEQTME